MRTAALALALSVLAACSRPAVPATDGAASVAPGPSVPHASGAPAAVSSVAPARGALTAVSSVAPAPGASAASCAAPAGVRPTSVDPDWRSWTCWPGCTFWLPPDRDALPAAIAWKPCAASAENAACREMVVPWSDGQGAPIAPDVVFSADERGTARLLVQRLAINGRGDAGSYSEWVVGQVDGPLEFAMRAGWPSPAPACWALNRDLSGGDFALSLHGDGSGPKTDVDGLLVGRLGASAPAVLFRDDRPGGNAWSIGARRIVRDHYGVVTARARDSERDIPIYDRALHPARTPFDGRPLVIRDDVVFQVANYVTAGIWAYDPRRGTHPLIHYPGDTTRGASNVGTDGKDLVWTYGEGKAAGEEGLYPIVSVMTAPYTTDPARLAPRRLRADRNLGVGSAVLQFAVGCGHAGRPLANGRDVQIVRLADGAGFVLRGNSNWAYQRVLGFTCDEVFLAVRSPTASLTVARVPLTSLGRALPAD